MNKDTYHEILYHLDIDDIQSFCSLSIDNKTICNDSSFWINLFKRDNVILFRKATNYHEWVNEYRKSLKASRMAKHLLDLLMVEAKKGYAVAFIQFKTNVLKPLLPNQMIDMYSLYLDKYRETSFVINVNRELKLFMSLYFNNETNKIHDILKDDLLTLLIKIFYNYPNINVTDEKRQPYIVKDLNQVYDDIGNPLTITRFNFKTLEDRKLYWDKL